MIYLLLLVVAAFLIFPIFLGMLIHQQNVMESYYDADDESVAIAWHLIEVNSEWIDKRC